MTMMTRKGENFNKSQEKLHHEFNKKHNLNLQQMKMQEEMQ